MPDQLQLPSTPPGPFWVERCRFHHGQARGTGSRSPVGALEIEGLGLQQWLPKLVDGPHDEKEHVHIPGSHVQVLAADHLSHLVRFLD